ncbi:hypothetical protein [Candidatus Phytoplasma oryzae]|nr:hypothetical protein PIE28_00310 [Candidatus Phytoplasma oryzae]
MYLLEKFFYFPRKSIQKLILGSFFIAISIVLSQINKFYPIIFNKSPYTDSHYFCYWYFPFFVMSLFFSFSYNLFFLFFYSFLEIFLYSLEKYLIQIHFLTHNYFDALLEKKIYLLINMIFFGSIIPILSYSLNYFLFFHNKNIYKKIFIFFLIVIIQSISRFLCGFFCYWGPNTKYYGLIYNKIFFFNKIKKSFFLYCFFMFFWNFIPIFVSNFILFVLFFIFRKFLLKNFLYKIF